MKINDYVYIDKLSDDVREQLIQSAEEQGYASTSYDYDVRFNIDIGYSVLFINSNGVIDLTTHMSLYGKNELTVEEWCTSTNTWEEEKSDIPNVGDTVFVKGNTEPFIFIVEYDGLYILQDGMDEFSVMKFSPDNVSLISESACEVKDMMSECSDILPLNCTELKEICERLHKVGYRKTEKDVDNQN